MKALRSPLIAGALAAALASTTGYCVLTNTGDGEPPLAPATTAPVRLLPEAIVPHPLEDLEPADEAD